MTNEPSPEVLAALDASMAARPENTEALAAIRVKAREVQALRHEIADMEERIKENNKKINTIQQNELVALFERAQIQDDLTIAAEGNNRGIVCSLKPYYSASIPANAEEAFRIEAFKALEEANAGNIIKTIVTISFPKEDRAIASEFVSRLPKNWDVEVKASVHAATLTKWLRETVEKKGVLPPLEKINGHVGRIVNVKDKK